jgi:AcrR family transcriptional regulator
MPRPRNPEHRAALLAAATRVFGTQGVSVSTAAIAKEAGVSTGTLFVYFDTKAALVNELFVELKTEMGRVATAGMPEHGPAHDQLEHMWNRWVEWALDSPQKRRALAHLSVADELTPDSLRRVHAAYAPIAALLDGIAQSGPMRGAPLDFVVTILSAIADATIDDVIRNPDSAHVRSALGFDALWRALAGADAPVPTTTTTGARQ